MTGQGLASHSALLASPRTPPPTHAHKQTLLPLTPTGELCDLEGNCVDAAEDEIFKLTTQVRAVECVARRVCVPALLGVADG